LSKKSRRFFILKDKKRGFNTMEQLTLGEFIKKLEEQPQDNEIQFDFAHFYPKEIHSYRGYYDQLAIGYKSSGNCPKVEEILQLCKDALGKYFTGYKGGDFLMMEDTPLWVANPEETGDTAIVDVIDAEWTTFIITSYYPT
jgi:hypothetical protein